MKNRKPIAVLAAVMMLLAACAEVPDDLKGSDSLASAAGDRVTCDNIYDGIDRAYKTEYTKFTLPDSGSIPVIKPDGLYRLVLAPVNSGNDLDRKIRAVNELNGRPGFGFKGETLLYEDTAYLKDGENEISMMGYLSPYVRWKEIRSGVSMLSEDIISAEAVYYDRPSEKGVPPEAEKAATKALELADVIGSVTGDGLENTISDIYILHAENDMGYEAEIRKAYKGVGIQNQISSRSVDPQDKEGEALMSLSMQSYADLDSELSPEYYVGCNSFKVKQSEKIGEVISFGTACDLLESELAEYVRFSFDTVLIMYEPRGNAPAEGESVSGEIRCRPKWYFITDKTANSGLHSIDYVTVDCENGGIEVVMP